MQFQKFRQCFLFLLTALAGAMVLSFTAGTAHACTDPAGDEGDMTYNLTYKTMMFCDGTDWWSMKGGAGGGGGSDTLSGLNCSTDQIAKYDGSQWVCADGAGGGGTTGDCSFSQSDNFDSGLGNWSNVGGDDHDWTLNSGDTPSGGVGPSDDATGGGQYVYTEASSPVGTNETFILQSNTINEDCALRIDFQWNKRGDTMGDLFLESYDGSTWTEIWSHSGSDVARNGTDRWNSESISAGSNVTQFRFRAVMPGSGDVWNSDIAVDDVTINEVIGVPDLSGLTCSTDQIAKYDGSGWVCADESNDEGGGFTSCQICIHCNYDGGSGMGTTECVSVNSGWSGYTGDPSNNGNPSSDNAQCRIRMDC